jgi:hypothetical protein
VRRVLPSLFIIADGPRPGHPTDTERCQQVRDVVSQIDWPCEVQRNYAEQNLGLKRRISSGLDWVFTQVESAVVLEDDCLPHPDFFTFCAEMLAMYKMTSAFGSSPVTTIKMVKNAATPPTIFQNTGTAGVGRPGGGPGNNLMVISSFGPNGSYRKIGVKKLLIRLSKRIGLISLIVFTIKKLTRGLTLG